MRMTADRLISVATTIAVVAVAGFAAVVSYSHFYDLGRAHGQDGTSARLTPLSVDLLILASSLILLWAARNRVKAPWAVRAVLIASVAATVAGNVLDGLPDGPVGAVLNGWPGAAFVAAVEILMWLVRAARKAAAAKAGTVPVTAPPGDSYAAAMAAFAASSAAGNPLTPNRLQTRFGLTRSQARKVHASIPIDAPAAATLSPERAAAGAHPNGDGRR
jgi:Protein of unknown function (DUF2637)